MIFYGIHFSIIIPTPLMFDNTHRLYIAASTNKVSSSTNKQSSTSFSIRASHVKKNNPENIHSKQHCNSIITYLN